MKNKKIVVMPKEELAHLIHPPADRYLWTDAIAAYDRLPVNPSKGKPRTKTDPKEISRRKTGRRDAILDLVAESMGYESWSNFGTQFLENIYPLEGRGTKAQFNAVVKVILLRSAKAVMAGANELDRELLEVIEKNPRIRKQWKK